MLGILSRVCGPFGFLIWRNGLFSNQVVCGSFILKNYLFLIIYFLIDFIGVIEFHSLLSLHWLIELYRFQWCIDTLKEPSYLHHHLLLKDGIYLIFDVCGVFS